MAQCKNPKCGVKVGCGCQLKDGLCPACYSEKQKATVPKPK